MPVFWKNPKRNRKTATASTGAGSAEPDADPQGKRPVLLLPVLLSTLAKGRTSYSNCDDAGYDNSVFSLAVSHVARREDDSGEYAEGRWEDRSRGNIGEDSWNYRVQGPFRAYLSYARPDFPDVPQPYKCYSIQGEVSGTCVSWVGENLQGLNGTPEQLEVPGIRIPFAAQILCYVDASQKRTEPATNTPE